MSNITTEKKLDELYELIEDMEVALMTTRDPDGRLVARPMATQEQGPLGDLWFVSNIETHKIDQIDFDPNVCIAYYNNDSREWVSVSGTAVISQDRAKIKELYEPDWKAWFGDEGGNRDGGPDDPRLALILVDAHAVTYMKSKYAKPRVLFELARGMITGETAELGREELLSSEELNAG
jgi:general stress protein 26